jgi:CDP-glycerol glycerophosphotransferase
MLHSTRTLNECQVNDDDSLVWPCLLEVSERPHAVSDVAPPVPVADWRARAKLGLRSLISRSIEAIARVLGPRAHVVVHGWPASEGNAVEVVRSLAARYRGQIYWLVDEPDDYEISAPENVRVVRKSSLPGVVKHATSEAVFFTHGLFGDVRPSRRQVFVNVWHGYGPKVNRDAQLSRRPIFPATYVVAGTELYGRRSADDFRVPWTTVILSGNPRIDQFWRPPSDEFRKRAGLDGRPYVVWMPTFRTRRQVGVAPVGRDVFGDVQDLMAAAEPLFAAMIARGIVVLLRRHPADAEAEPVAWATDLSDEVLGEARTNLYSVLGGAAGIVTDYSSVWTDYLVLDRPIGFYAPDRSAYQNGRGLYPPDVHEWLPGIDLLAPGGPERFADEILVDPQRSAKLRETARARIGLVQEHSAADRLLTELNARGAFARSGGLRTSEARVDGVGAFRRARS